MSSDINFEEAQLDMQPPNQQVNISPKDLLPIKENAPAENTTPRRITLSPKHSPEVAIAFTRLAAAKIVSDNTAAKLAEAFYAISKLDREKHPVDYELITKYLNAVKDPAAATFDPDAKNIIPEIMKQESFAAKELIKKAEESRKADAAASLDFNKCLEDLRKSSSTIEHGSLTAEKPPAISELPNNIFFKDPKILEMPGDPLNHHSFIETEHSEEKPKILKDYGFELYARNGGYSGNKPYITIDITYGTKNEWLYQKMQAQRNVAYYADDTPKTKAKWEKDITLVEQYYFPQGIPDRLKLLAKNPDLERTKEDKEGLLVLDYLEAQQRRADDAKVSEKYKNPRIELVIDMITGRLTNKPQVPEGVLKTMQKCEESWKQYNHARIYLEQAHQKLKKATATPPLAEMEVPYVNQNEKSSGSIKLPNLSEPKSMFKNFERIEYFTTDYTEDNAKALKNAGFTKIAKAKGKPSLVVLLVGTNGDIYDKIMLGQRFETAVSRTSFAEDRMENAFEKTKLLINPDDKILKEYQELHELRKKDQNIALKDDQNEEIQFYIDLLREKAAKEIKKVKDPLREESLTKTQAAINYSETAWEQYAAEKNKLEAAARDFNKYDPEGYVAKAPNTRTSAKYLNSLITKTGELSTGHSRL